MASRRPGATGALSRLSPTFVTVHFQPAQSAAGVPVDHDLHQGFAGLHDAWGDRALQLPGS